MKYRVIFLGFIYMGVTLASNSIPIKPIAITSKTVASDSYHSLIFDPELDQNVGDEDPRIKSIVYVAQNNKGSVIEISYSDTNALNLVTNLARLFTRHNLLVLKPKLVNKPSNESDVVIVNIKN